MLVIHQKSFESRKDLIKMVNVTLEGLWMVSERIVDFRFSVKFHMSGLAIPPKSSQSSKRPHLDGEYHSGRIMDGF